MKTTTTTLLNKVRRWLAGEGAVPMLPIELRAAADTTPTVWAEHVLAEGLLCTFDAFGRCSACGRSEKAL